MSDLEKLTFSLQDRMVKHLSLEQKLLKTVIFQRINKVVLYVQLLKVTRQGLSGMR